MCIAAWGDKEKWTVLTLSPTIQRASQRAILAIASTMMAKGLVIYHRDVEQAFTQSKTTINRLFYFWAPPELCNEMGIPRMQIDDTIGLVNSNFAALEEDKITGAKIKCKKRGTLTVDKLLSFNGGCNNIKLVNVKEVATKTSSTGVIRSNLTPKDQYIAQRAGASYIGTMCQPESLYDCVIRLSMTLEKRMMIDVMVIRDAYEERELTEIKWVVRDTNPADSMTKIKAYNALKNMINTNFIDITINEWVMRPEAANF
ncbi:hypothetical protein EPUL_002747 [Erysiphe pulchra]|uniref:Reverse transcriptase Ty1/copia-type domain-containing protein n=1 Tax=Erysiphe pulchra TaxID=225359 RepID=A0A2S4PYW3_9PEZI|nr:hypothetical protein EPUL_002747 [Erysiphe pulchra]